MLKTNKNLILYHGSYCNVPEPDLKKCAKYKDFGQGFYLTTSKEQAQRFSLTSLKKAIANGTVDEHQNYGIVSVFRCPLEEWDLLNTCEFETADSKWLNCIAGHRKGKTFGQFVRQDNVRIMV